MPLFSGGGGNSLLGGHSNSKHEQTTNKKPPSATNTPITTVPAPARNLRSRLGQIEAIDLEITVIQGHDLVAKDRNLFGKHVSSDPFVKVVLAQELPIKPDEPLGGGAFRKSVRALGNRFSSRDLMSGNNGGGVEKQTLKLGKTKTIYKTLNPVWNDTIVGSLRGQENLKHHTPHQHPAYLEFHIFDEDQLSRSDNMGIVTVPIPTEPRNMDFTQWYPVPPDSAKHASGQIQIRIQTTLHRSHILVRGNTFALSNYNKKSHLKTKQTIKLGLSWDVVPKNSTHTPSTTSPMNQQGEEATIGTMSTNQDNDEEEEEEGVDLDASCVAVSHEGYVIMPDTVYYGNLTNSNGSVIHSGDEQEGRLEGDDESITLQLDKIPNHVLAMYIILTVATPNMALSDVQSTRVRVKDVTALHDDDNDSDNNNNNDNQKHQPLLKQQKSFRQEQTLCTFTPSTHTDSSDATAMFMVRIARDQSRVPKGKVSKKWILTPMEDTHPTARDFGTLIPHIKSYTRDLVPNIHIDPTERVAILRKGGNIRVQDYCPKQQLPTKITFGLAWDVTNGQDIDLDASAICLDSNLNLVDMIWWKQLHSKDYNIVHHGDEREGDQLGDDELIDLFLNNMSLMGEHCHVQYIGFVINSYSGQKLKDVDRASCHLFDPDTNIEMATYALTNAKALEGVSALLVACLYRAIPKYDHGVVERIPGTVPKASTTKNAKEGEWCMTVISENCQGRTVKANVEDFQNYLRQHPPEAATVSCEEDDANSIIQAEMPPHVPLAEEHEFDNNNNNMDGMSNSTPTGGIPPSSSSAASISMTEEEKRNQYDSEIAAEEGIRRPQPKNNNNRGGSATTTTPVAPPPPPPLKSPSVAEQTKRSQFDLEIKADEGIQPAASPKVTPSLLEQEKRNRFDFEIHQEKKMGNSNSVTPPRPTSRKPSAAVTPPRPSTRQHPAVTAVTPPTLIDQDKRNRFDVEIEQEKKGGRSR